MLVDIPESVWIDVDRRAHGAGVHEADRRTPRSTRGRAARSRSRRTTSTISPKVSITDNGRRHLREPATAYLRAVRPGAAGRRSVIGWPRDRVYPLRARDRRASTAERLPPTAPEPEAAAGSQSPSLDGPPQSTRREGYQSVCKQSGTVVGSSSSTTTRMRHGCSRRRFASRVTRSRSATMAWPRSSSLGTTVPEIAFLDIGLPGIDGYTLCTRLREMPTVPKVVAVTGYGQAADRDRARQAGFDMHFVKPVSLREVHQAIASFSRT